MLFFVKITHVSALPPIEEDADRYRSPAGVIYYIHATNACKSSVRKSLLKNGFIFKGTVKKGHIPEKGQCDLKLRYGSGDSGFYWTRFWCESKAGSFFGLGFPITDYKSYIKNILEFVAETEQRINQ